MTSDEALAFFAAHTDIRLVILRGLPGSGKSTFARRLVRELNFSHFEADAHFTDAQGRYAFDPARVADAHAVCQQQTDTALRAGQRVVLGNTHVKAWELSAPIGLAVLHRARFRVVQCTGQWENTHNVKAEIITKMRDKWEPLPEHLHKMLLNLDDQPQILHG